MYIKMRRNSIKNLVKALLIMTLIMTGPAGCGAKDASNEKNYTVESVLEKCGLGGYDEFSEDGNTFYYQKIDNYDCTYIGIIDTENAYTGYQFYVFRNAKDAKKEFEKRKKDWFSEDDKDLEIGDNYVCGWEQGVMDANIKAFDYLSGNLIVERHDESIGSDAYADDEWYDEYFSEEAVKARAESDKQTHEKIMNEW